MKIRSFVAALAVCSVVAGLGRAASAADPIVTLTMAERLGVARSGEPVVIGVPFGPGVVKGPAVSLTDAAGRPLACEFVPIVKWPDGSTRWAHLYFLADCPANGSAQVRIVPGQLPTRGPGMFDVQDAADKITVTAGPLVFVVKKKGFDLIDQAWIHGGEVIAPHDRGPVLVENGVEFKASLDPDVKVAVEERGAMHAVIRAEGSHRNKAGDKRLDFVCRLYAFAGSPVVRVDYTFVNRQGAKISEFVPLAGLTIELPTTIRGGQVLFGDEGGPKQGKLAGDAKEAFVFASDSDAIAFGGAVSGSSKGKSSKPRKIGWADLSDGQVGLAAGVRWFWQMFPKSVEANSDGVLSLGLYPARAKEPRNIYVGVARTHYTQLVFHGKADAAALAGAFAGLEDPLRPFAPPAYYCRTAHAFGNVVEADAAQYKPEYRALVADWDKSFQANWAKFDKQMDGRQAGHDTDDDYGLLEWGDNYHYKKDAAWGTLHEWNGNYYGYPHMMCLQFARTGDAGYFDHFEAHAAHVADVHTTHYDPKGTLTGASRYCPPGDHVRFDSPPNYPVYISNTFNHFKNEGIFERWYFTGDRRMLDVLAEQRRLVLEYKGADKSGSQPRGAGHLMMTLVKFYEDTGEPIFLQRAKAVFDRNKDVVVKEKSGKANFQQGLQLEGARRYYEISGDAEVLEYLKRWAKFFQDTGTLQHNAAQAFGFLYARTGDKQYLDLAMACILRNTGDQAPAGVAGTPGLGLKFSKEKDFALTMRNGPYFFYYLSNAAPAVPPPGK